MAGGEGPGGGRPESARSAADLAEELAAARAQEAERTRLLSMARDTGFRIREHLHVEDLVREARVAIEENFNCDQAYLHLVTGGVVGPPIGHEHDWLMKPDFLDFLGHDFVRLMREVLVSRSSFVVQDMTGHNTGPTPARVRQELRAAGVVSLALLPFGVGSDLFGVLVAVRLQRGRPWTPAELAAMEWIAADLGRGLHQARLYEEENQLVARLQAVDQAKSEFIATVSHELRVPLTSIAGFVEILRDQAAGPLNPVQEGMLDAVDRNAGRLRNLIENLLTLAKIEAGTFRTAVQPVSLADVVRSGEAALKPQADRKGVLFSSQCPESLVVRGDPGQLDRLVMNLLSNAVKFTPAGGRVELVADAEDGMGVIRVADTGIGIPEPDQKELFTRFFRASNAVEQAIPGTGLGLTVVHSIVANHGGQLEVRSREGEGTTVTVRIPQPTGDAAA